MHRRTRAYAIVSTLALALPLALAPTGAAAAPDVGGRSDAAPGHVKEQPPRVEKWQAERAAAADLVAQGKAQPDDDGIVQLRNGTFVQHRLQGTDHIVTVLADFSDVHHNEIPEPDRSVDNSTYWIADFDRGHYLDMLFADGGGSYGFPSMRDFYLQQSSGTYTVEGQVSNWAQLPETQAYYGANTRQEGAGSDNLYGPVYKIVKDAAAAASTDPAVDWSPSIVDVWDRYDCDGDGNFDEPDGYVDHFQLIHAGQGEEAGASPDTIWSHRWYANFAGADGFEGPAGCPFGGYPVGDTGLWIGDYTIEPENGGVGVFAHEFAHDLGLPDLYDTAGGENGTGFWTLMSSGSWASDDPNAIDTKPVHMGIWEKLVLGWMDLARVSLGEDTSVDLGPAEGDTRRTAQGLRVDLPDHSKVVTVFPPDADPTYWYSGSGDDLDNTMTHTLASETTAPASLTFRTNYDIEVDWDYAYARALVGGTWQELQTNLSTTTNPNGQNFGFGITGSSGGWVDGTATVPAGATAVQFRYWTDVAVAEPGIAIDTVALGGTPLTTWSLAGFSEVTDGQVEKSFFHYYLVESRSYVRNDTSLCGAYNFLWGNWLEKQCYADGLLIWYRNSEFSNNNTSQHPGGGQVLPVDSHPAPSVTPDGRSYLRSRWQVWDATFGVDPHAVTLHQQQNANAKVWERTYDAAPVSGFHDSSPTAYWDARIPRSSVKTAGSGLRVDITGVSPDRGTYRVHVYD